MSGTHDLLAAERAAAGNQGIFDGRPEGQQPPAAPVTLDTVVDTDAFRSSQSPLTTAESTLGGATSADVHQGKGHPVSGMTSKELHHDGKVGRKRETQIHTSGSKPKEVEEL